MPDLKYLVIVVDTHATPKHRHGTLVPVGADGFYLREEDAKEAAAHMAEQFAPHMTTLVVEVVGNAA